jgi:formylglycine-generating enzyme required for sulfatase activity
MKLMLLVVCLLGMISYNRCLADEPTDSFRGDTPGEVREDNSLAIALVWVPGGEFVMGSKDSQADADETLVHAVLKSGFWIGITEITEGQWRSVMSSEPWKEYGKPSLGDDFPARAMPLESKVAMPDNSIKRFCEILTDRDHDSGKLPRSWLYTIPSEAQWERACRAGKNTRYCFGDDAIKLGDYAWFRDNTALVGERYPHEVARKTSNAWGIYDMHGNVKERCRGGYSGANPGGVNPFIKRTSQGGVSRGVTRGGSWLSKCEDLRCSDRNRTMSSSGINDAGFRVIAMEKADYEW